MSELFSPDMKKLPLGQRVRVLRVYEKNDHNQWDVRELDEPIVGILTGYRTLVDMYFESETDEMSGRFYSWWELGSAPSDRHPCIYVVFDVRRNHIRAPLDGFELVHEIWCGKCGWSGTDKDTQRIGKHTQAFMCGNESCGYMAYDMTMAHLEKLQAPKGETA